MKIKNPYTQQIITEFPEDTIDSITEKFLMAKQAQKKWENKLLTDRLQIVRTFQQLLVENKEELAKVLTSEVGKPISQSRNELNGAIARIQFFLDETQNYLEDQTVVQSEELNEIITYEPLGVVLNISAWNYPYLVGVNVFIPALLAGNSVLYKPSEYATLTGKRIEEYLHKAGVPPHVFQCCVGGGDVGKLLLTQEIDGVYFTGSYPTGLSIKKTVVHRFIPVQLELGGKDPVYITEDVEHVSELAYSVADGAFYNAGQSCCAIERIYVHETIYSAFLDAFIECVKQFKVGDPFLEDTYIGPLTRPEHLSFLNKQVEDAINKGATLCLGGKTKDTMFFLPTVLSDVTSDMKVMSEESFGPIIGIQSVSSDEEAIMCMNDTSYGLTAGVFSTSYTRAKVIFKQMNTGTVYWNCSDRVSPYLPWSGRKHSGIGLTLSHLGIRAFSVPKAYHLKQP